MFHHNLNLFVFGSTGLLSVAAFHGNTLRSLVYFIHMDSYTRRIPFPYSFGSRVGYYSIRCYLAPISVSPISKALGILRIAINPLTIQARPHNSTIRLLFRCSHRSRRLACSIELLSRLVLRKARPTCKPTFNVWHSHNSTLFVLFTHYSC